MLSELGKWISQSKRKRTIKAKGKEYETRNARLLPSFLPFLFFLCGGEGIPSVAYLSSGIIWQSV